MGGETRERAAGCKAAICPAESARPAVAENQPASQKQNRMITKLTFTDFAAQLREFIARGSRSDEVEDELESEFNRLALSLFQLQFQNNLAYRLLCSARRISPANISQWQEVPAVPASAFKELELTSLAADDRLVCFLSSGTTEQSRSRHFHSAESRALYEASLLAWFERHLLADLNDLVEEQLLGLVDKLPFLALTPPPASAPHSSLVHMFETVRREFGSRDSLFAGRVDANGAWMLDIDAALFAIRKSMCANRPLALLGTAFNFVHLLDHFIANNMRYQLAQGSRGLETGGYKGQSREVPKVELHALIKKHLGISPEYIVAEYGMSELSSQAYDRVAGEVQGSTFNVQSPQVILSPYPHVFRFPPWCRAQIISPETGCEVLEGETGLLRIFDLANVRSVMAIQTEDLAVRRGDGFELIGRAAQSEPRGCSLMSSHAETKRR
jgi:hypothetical protein